MLPECHSACRSEDLSSDIQGFHHTSRSPCSLSLPYALDLILEYSRSHCSSDTSASAQVHASDSSAIGIAARDGIGAAGIGAEQRRSESFGAAALPPNKPPNEKPPLFFFFALDAKRRMR